jgi:hypothetical protein
MTEQERREIKAKLIELGFWRADEPGNPAADYLDATTLNQRVDAKVAEGVFVVSMVVSSYSSARQILVLQDEQMYPLITADNYPEAVCLAALALSEFLKEHPECAADSD